MKRDRAAGPENRVHNWSTPSAGEGVSGTASRLLSEGLARENQFAILPGGGEFVGLGPRMRSKSPSRKREGLFSFYQPAFAHTR